VTDKQVRKTEQLFRKVKEGHPGALLLFRFDDFYEAFFEDAEVCSEVCGLDLTEEKKSGELVPLVEIPVWLIAGYIRKLLAAGYTVALSELLNGRDIVRVVSPRCKDKTQQAKVYKQPSSHRPQLRLVRPAG